ncbi:hypothetical protein SAMN05444411_1433 [Lutibacter oricola]|uniref:Uncharacterized protein n=1 Tax=Lutibacter oricola TaxID=762486 RepID=A0A1H3HJN6_9FLAO|nr:hypothetical protein [Lutibacter oricola]SDY15697.1 hypothetical protein SAMN05444411_1433 [Lutibacter oricola]
MKRLKIALPLTIISFIMISKLWYVKIIDAPNSILYGFPIPYSCAAWHTSMARQFFILEFIFDFMIYLIFWIMLLYLIDKFIFKIKISKLINNVLIIISGLMILLNGLIVLNPDNIFKMSNEFDYKIVETKIDFLWNDYVSPEHSKKKRND